MSRKRTPEQIIAKLREAEVALSQGETTGQLKRRPRGNMLDPSPQSL